MIEKIISNPNGFRDLLLAAQGLVNEQFNANAQTMFGAEVKKTAYSQKLKKFKKVVKESTLLTEEEKKLFKNDNNSYRLAREIILQFTAKEIKNPLTK